MENKYTYKELTLEDFETIKNILLDTPNVKEFKLPTKKELKILEDNRCYQIGNTWGTGAYFKAFSNELEKEFKKYINDKTK